MIVQTWTDVIMASLQNLWDGFVAFIPALLGALVVFIVGWLVAMALGRIVTRILQAIQIDKIFDQLGIMKAVHKSGLDWEFSGFMGWIVKWFLLIAFFLAAADILGLSEVAVFLTAILAYIPNIFVAALILVIAALVSDFLEKLIKASIKAADFSAPKVVGVMVRWSVWIFAFLAVFNQLGIASTLINTFFMGFIAFLALAGGLAFGFGGQGVAKDWLEKLSKEVGK
jgi:small-conductance mechanosensitive channel